MIVKVKAGYRLCFPRLRYFYESTADLGRMSYLPRSSLVGMRGHFAVYNFRLVRLSLRVWLCYELPGDSTLAPWLDGRNLPAFMCPTLSARMMTRVRLFRRSRSANRHMPPRRV